MFLSNFKSAEFNLKISKMGTGIFNIFPPPQSFQNNFAKATNNLLTVKSNSAP